MSGAHDDVDEPEDYAVADFVPSKTVTAMILVIAIVVCVRAERCLPLRR